jgi:uncharacterized membrane protein
VRVVVGVSIPPATQTASNTFRVPSSIRRAMSSLERSRGIEPIADRIEAVGSYVGRGGRGSLLRGEWLGHALHPLATDFPLGCWLAAGFLDVAGRRGDRAAARRLIGVGLLFAIPTAATGLAEYAGIRDARSRRVGAAHAIGNLGVLGGYAMSWNARRRGRHARGVALATLSGCAAWVTGYLGGHLSFARNVGSGERGMDLDGDEVITPPTSPEHEAHEALLASGAETVRVAGDEKWLQGPNSR